MKADLSTLPLRHFGLIMADPPWTFTVYRDEGQVVPYNTMDLDEICDMRISNFAADDCALLLWGTSPLLESIFTVLDAWGFKYKGKAFSWAKTNPRQFDGPASSQKTWHMGRGYGTRSNTEDCWLATRGSPKRLSMGVRELIVAPVRDHSRKPDEAYERAERLFPGPRLDLFSRQKRRGWVSWGDEVSKFTERPTCAERRC